MPLDGSDVGLAHRLRLADAARNPMPPDFRWYFPRFIEADKNGCGSLGCGGGLACMLWPEHAWRFSGGDGITALAEFFGMSVQAVERVFFNAGPFYPVPAKEVTPAMFADALEGSLP